MADAGASWFIYLSAIQTSMFRSDFFLFCMFVDVPHAKRMRIPANKPWSSNHLCPIPLQLNFQFLSGHAAGETHSFKLVDWISKYDEKK